MGCEKLLQGDLARTRILDNMFEDAAAEYLAPVVVGDVAGGVGFGPCSVCMELVQAGGVGRELPESYPCCGQHVHAGCLRDLEDRRIRECPN